MGPDDESVSFVKAAPGQLVVGRQRLEPDVDTIEVLQEFSDHFDPDLVCRVVLLLVPEQIVAEAIKVAVDDGHQAVAVPPLHLYDRLGLVLPGGGVLLVPGVVGEVEEVDHFLVPYRLPVF